MAYKKDEVYYNQPYDQVDLPGHRNDSTDRKPWTVDPCMNPERCTKEPEGVLYRRFAFS